jgi:hypothetical protein
MNRLLAILSASMISLPVFAGVVTVDFSFSDLKGGNLPTLPLLAGSFSYEASSLAANPGNLLSVDIVFDQHTYSVSDLILAKPGPFMDSPFYSLFGPNDWTVVDGGTDDFYLDFDPSTQTFSAFGITGVSLPGSYSVTSFSPGVSFNMSFNGPANTVPEPGSLALLGLGFAGLVAARSRKLSLQSV